MTATTIIILCVLGYAYCILAQHERRSRKYWRARRMEDLDLLRSADVMRREHARIELSLQDEPRARL